MNLYLLLAGASLSPGIASAFQFPKIKFVGIPTKEDLNAPPRVLQNGPEDAENLRRSLEKHCGIPSQSETKADGIAFLWELELEQSYEVADVVFREIARVLHKSNDRKQQSSTEDMPIIPGEQIVLSFPMMTRQDDLDKLSAVLRSDRCKNMLGLEDSRAELYPSSPAPYLRITFSSQKNMGEAQEVDHDVKFEISSTTLDSAAASTEDWVNNFLGKYRLCPYTSSVTRAAVGLSSVGVPVGGVHVRAESANAGSAPRRSDEALRAASLVSSFWSEVVTLMDSAQEEWATSLVVFPEYDTDFESFVDVCDSIIEPTVVATQATEFIGRAWFHPQYDAHAVGHSEVVAGHAVPHKMVEMFMKSLRSSGGNDEEELLEYDELARANDQVRRTPHATINILRRSQLSAAGEYERGLGVKQPKANSIYVRNAERLARLIKQKNP